MSEDKPTSVVRRRKKTEPAEEPKISAEKMVESWMADRAKKARDAATQDPLTAPAPAKAAATAEPERPKGKVPPRRNYELVDGIDPFELFAAYHLGVTADDGYRPQNVHDLARRFKSSPARVNEALRAYEIDAETVMNTDFDLYDAQYDVQVAPAGVSKTEIARWHYEQFRSSPRIARNWTDEIATDAAENRKIFDRLK